MSAMASKALTPAQAYAKSVIDALSCDDLALAMELVKDRPQTLKNAMKSYLYYSIQKRNRETKKGILWHI